MEPRNQPPLKKCINTEESIQVTMHQEKIALGGMEAPHLTADEEARGRDKSPMFGRLSGSLLSTRGRAGLLTPLLCSHCFLTELQRGFHGNWTACSPGSTLTCSGRPLPDAPSNEGVPWAHACVLAQVNESVHQAQKVLQVCANPTCMGEHPGALRPYQLQSC